MARGPVTEIGQIGSDLQRMSQEAGTALPVVHTRG